MTYSVISLRRNGHAKTSRNIRVVNEVSWLINLSDFKVLTFKSSVRCYTCSYFVITCFIDIVRIC